MKTQGQPPSLQILGEQAVVCLHRPSQANRLSPGDLAVLHQHMAVLRERTDLRLVLLRAQGPHFCAGFQIDAVGSVDAPALFEALTDAWEALPQLTVAVVQGDAWGGAVDWALACDFRLGAAQGRVGIPAARLGLHYHGGGLRRVVSRLGLGAAKRLLLAAEVWEGPQRLAQGFLDDQDEHLEALVDRWVARLLALAPLAQQGMKRQLNALAAGSMDLAALRADQARCANSADLVEGLAAWAQKRAPRFSGA